MQKNEQKKLMKCRDNTEKNTKATKDWERKFVQATLSTTILGKLHRKEEIKKQH